MSDDSASAAWPLWSAAVLLAVALAGLMLWLGATPPPEGVAVINDRPPQQWDRATRDKVQKIHHAIEHYITSDQLPKAQLIAEKHTIAFPNDPTGHYLMAKLRFAQQRPEDAFEHFERALALDDDQDEVAFEAAAFAPDPKRVLALYRRAVELKPESAKYRMNLGAYLLKLNDTAAAEAQLLEARRLDASLSPIHAMLAEITGRAGRHAEAIEHIDRALDTLNPQSPKRIAYTVVKASLLRRAERPDAALRVLAQLGPRDARHPAAVEEAARCHTAMGAHPKAAVEWMSLSLEDPKNVRYAKRTAHAFLAAGDARGAQPYVVLAQQLAPDDPEVIELGRALTAAQRTASP